MAFPGVGSTLTHFDTWFSGRVELRLSPRKSGIHSLGGWKYRTALGGVDHPEDHVPRGVRDGRIGESGCLNVTCTHMYGGPQTTPNSM